MSTPDASADRSGITLPRQFLLAGGVVMIIAMAIVGYWVSSRIEDAVVENSANAAALYMESFVSPLTQELGEGDTLSVPAQQALREIFTNTALGERVVSYKIWKEGGLVVHASDAEIIGQRFPPTGELKAAWKGNISGAFEDLNDEESRAEEALGMPLLEVYSPIRENYSGRIIAVAEFYERAELLAKDLADARRSAWLLVGTTFISSGLLLFGIVNAGGRVIRNQAALLRQRLIESQAMARQNADLRTRVVEASARAAAQSDRFLRQLGSDLHDGPAQHLALAAMRLGRTMERAGVAEADQDEVRGAITAAMDEIRAISRGLAIPDLDSLDLRGLIGRVVSDHSARGATPPEVEHMGADAPPLGYSAKVCAFRFMQEALSNAARHAPGARVRLSSMVGKTTVSITVADEGPGFQPSEAMKLRDDGGQGLLGLTDRAESIGGTLEIESGGGKGARLTLTLPIGSGDQT